MGNKITIHEAGKISLRKFRFIFWYVLIRTILFPFVKINGQEINIWLDILFPKLKNFLCRCAYCHHFELPGGKKKTDCDKCPLCAVMIISCRDKYSFFRLWYDDMTIRNTYIMFRYIKDSLQYIKY